MLAKGYKSENKNLHSKKPNVLENISFFPETNKPNYADGSITQNTRVAYPIEHIESAQIPCITCHPKNVILLTCDVPVFPAN